MASAILSLYYRIMHESSIPDPASAEQLARALFEVFPLPVFVVNADLEVVTFNPSAARMVGPEKELVIRRLGGDALHCVHSYEVGGDCAQSEQCRDCIIRQSVSSAERGQRVVRKTARMEALTDMGARELELLVTAAPFRHQGRRLVLLILEDVSELMALRRLVPMCARCKKVRDDRAAWLHVEEFLTTRMNVDLTHSYCPDCADDIRERYDLRPQT